MELTNAAGRVVAVVHAGRWKLNMCLTNADNSPQEKLPIKTPHATAEETLEERIQVVHDTDP